MSASCTAQITVGSPTSYWGGPGVGIGPSHVMYLVEGARTAWILETVAHQTERGVGHEPTTWVAGAPDRILADGLLMIAALVENDPDVRKLIESRVDQKRAQALLDERWAELDGLSGDVLDELEAAAREAVHSKLVVAVTDGSSVTGQLALLDRCSMEAEVCTASWIRVKRWSQEAGDDVLQTAGTLPPEDPEAHRFYALRI